MDEQFEDLKTDGRVPRGHRRGRRQGRDGRAAPPGHGTLADGGKDLRSYICPTGIARIYGRGRHREPPGGGCWVRSRPEAPAVQNVLTDKKSLMRTALSSREQKVPMDRFRQADEVPVSDGISKGPELVKRDGGRRPWNAGNAAAASPSKASGSAGHRLRPAHERCLCFPSSSAAVS